MAYFLKVLSHRFNGGCAPEGDARHSALKRRRSDASEPEYSRAATARALYGREFLKRRELRVGVGGEDPATHRTESAGCSAEVRFQHLVIAESRNPIVGYRERPGIPYLHRSDGSH